ncbi:YfbK domain-containing protein [Carboxylicivirga sp. N1Y90]|uniref:vWA domain-containing protein n=1 Tax=Carboxylicivirga fragile TaxID=3417571 RepID=UPI003D3555F9|nr:von Willebrand factor type A domain-containing protein [Marinilabiliaceae bacterium N1Y90]
MRRLALLLGMFMVVAVSAFSQRYITGQVSDESGSVLPGVNVVIKNTTIGVVTDPNGEYQIKVNSENDVLVFMFIGMISQEIKVEQRNVINVMMKSDAVEIEECVVVSGLGGKVRGLNVFKSKRERKGPPMLVRGHSFVAYEQDFNTESYAGISENGYKQVTSEPLSTFSVDVDRASYTNVRRFLNQGQLPPEGSVRIEEMINYFNYDYEEPEKEHPFAVNSEMATCPWNDEHYLLKVGLKGKEIEKDNLPASNLVFLIDVSGSMNASNKLPLLKSSFRLLVNELRDEDYVSIVVYAGAAGLVLEPTSGQNKKTILDALDKLQAGGSTAGGAGLKLAYATAKEHFVEDGNNRIILATDGDFNVGESSNASMEQLVADERDNGIYMTVLGFGMGNYKDDRMEIIADKGNGNYAYIDNLQEAQKTLVSEFGGTLFTIAKDVKFQIEFNPEQVLAYRLIGYENRLLNDEDFNDDTRDAGEIGAGHTVTALYEIIPQGADDAKKWIKSVDELKYQKKQKRRNVAMSDDWLTLKLRYKRPDEKASNLMEYVIKGDVDAFDEASKDFRFAASVAAFGMILSDSKYKGDIDYEDLKEMAKESRGNDEDGFKAEMIRLIKTAESLSSQVALGK